MHQIKYKLLSSDLHAPLYSHGIGGDKEVGVVKQRYLWPLHEQQEGELDEEHEGQLPYAADLQEHRAGQQRQQHTVAKILEQREGVRRSPGGTAEQLEALGITGFLYFFFFPLTSGKGQEGPWLRQISRPPSTDTFKLRIRQGVTSAAEVFRFSATHCAKLLVSQANLGQGAEQNTGTVS